MFPKQQSPEIYEAKKLIELKGEIHNSKIIAEGFPGGAAVENLPANAGDTGSSPGLGRSHVPRSSWAREP